jgi:hypothetical protein
VHRYSGGIPRLVNTICDNALFEGFVAGEAEVDSARVEQVARDLALEPVAALRAPAPAPPASAPRVDLEEIDRYLDSLLE